MRSSVSATRKRHDFSRSPRIITPCGILPSALSTRLSKWTNGISSAKRIAHDGQQHAAASANSRATVVFPIEGRAPMSQKSPGPGPPFVKSVSLSHGVAMMPQGTASSVSMPMELTAAPSVGAATVSTSKSGSPVCAVPSGRGRFPPSRRRTSIPSLAMLEQTPHTEDVPRPCASDDERVPSLLDLHL